jgi:hypothetical protein
LSFCEQALTPSATTANAPNFVSLVIITAPWNVFLLAVWAVRVDAQRVDIRLHQTAERSIYHPMSLQSLGAGESPRDNSDAKVTATILRSCMTRVPVAVVDDVELVRRERLLEPTSDHGNSVRGHERT